MSNIFPQAAACSSCQQFAVTWNAISSIDTKNLLEAQSTHFGMIRRNPAVLSPSSSSSLEKAISSVVLIAVGEGSWASGIVLNKSGLILTNAHTLEPWRFGRSQLGSIENSTSLTELETSPGQKETGIHLPPRFGSSINVHGETFSGHRSYNRRISIRLDFMEQKKWYGARAVYVSKGPLDVALLQLESVPPQLSPITPQLDCPSVGSVVYVIGHGLLGPWSSEHFNFFLLYQPRK